MERKLQSIVIFSDLETLLVLPIMSWKFRSEGKGSGKREEREQRTRHKGYRTVLQGDYHKEKRLSFQFSSVQLLSHADFLWPHGLQHARLPCLSPTPRAYSNSCPLSRGWHPTISSSVVPFSSCLQSFPASGSFTVSHLFASGGQSIGVSASASVLPMKFKTDFF